MAPTVYGCSLPCVNPAGKWRANVMLMEKFFFLEHSINQSSLCLFATKTACFTIAAHYVHPFMATIYSFIHSFSEPLNLYRGCGDPSLTLGTKTVCAPSHLQAHTLTETHSQSLQSAPHHNMVTIYP